MAIMRRFLAFFSFTLVFGSAFASAPIQDWESVVATLRSTLDVLQLSHEQYLAQAVQHSKRDSTFRTGPAGYWQPLANRRRLDPSDDFSEQLNDLISSIGDSFQQLLELLASQFTVGSPASSVVASSTPTSFGQPSILPITNLTTPPALPTSHAAVTTSRSLVLDSPLHTSSPPPPLGSYTFNPSATDLNVVYYSQDRKSVV